MSYSFTVFISAKDTAFFTTNNYLFNVIKDVGATSGTPTCWIATPVQGTTISVSWSEVYNIFFTTTDISASGAIVTQGSKLTNALVGSNYKFALGNFSSAGYSTSPSSIQISNNSGANNYFGVSQDSIINGVAVDAPLIVAPITTNGTGNFSPKISLKLFFSANYSTPGMVFSGTSNPFSVSVTPGTAGQFSYDTGRWNNGPLTKKESITLVPSPKSQKFSYLVNLNGQIPSAFLAQSLAKRINVDQSRVHVNTPKGSVYQVFFFAESNRNFEDLVGETIVYLSKSLNEEGSYDLKGLEVNVVGVTPLEDEATVMYNYKLLN